MASHIAPLESFLTSIEREAAPSAWDTLQRACDILLVVVNAPLWVALLAILAISKLLIDGGPAFFRHVRLGRNGQPFVLYKIRTTPREFEAQPNDWSDDRFPERTRFGSWLRQRDLDEIPQLWNVLKGEMSLIGPRPEMPSHSELFSCRIPGYAQRLTVLPGLTGLAQARGWRGNTGIRPRTASDLEYLARRGPRMYFQILAKTAALELRRAFLVD